jgi:hypothetical protein
MVSLAFGRNGTNAMAVWTRGAISGPREVSAGNMDDVREESAPTAPVAFSRLLLTGDSVRERPVIHTSPGDGCLSVDAINVRQHLLVLYRHGQANPLWVVEDWWEVRVEDSVRPVCQSVGL